jgi:hypothetical protein
MAALVRKTCAYLREKGGKKGSDPFSFAAGEAGMLGMLEDYFGRRYALDTEEGMKAVEMMSRLEGIRIEGTYTGKTLAATIDYSLRHRYEEKTILFWNTYNSADLSAEARGVDYHVLPRGFRRYFERPVQELDRQSLEEKR